MNVLLILTYQFHNHSDGTLTYYKTNVNGFCVSLTRSTVLRVYVIENVHGILDCFAAENKRTAVRCNYDSNLDQRFPLI